MVHTLFDWDFENIQHIARHGVTPEEVESVLGGDTMFVAVGEEHDELRTSEAGMTASGRILFVGWVPRNSQIRVVTAFAPGTSLKKQLLEFEGEADMPVVPHFENEADEADWWFNNQDLVAAEFERVQPKLGPRRARRFLQEMREKKGLAAQNSEAGSTVDYPRSA